MQWRRWDCENCAAVKFIYSVTKLRALQKPNHHNTRLTRRGPGLPGHQDSLAINRGSRVVHPHPSSHFTSYKIPPTVTNILLLDWKFWTSILFSQKIKISAHPIRLQFNLSQISLRLRAEILFFNPVNICHLNFFFFVSPPLIHQIST